MLFHIRKVVLWPRQARFKPRVVDFVPGVLNVITGASQTGKSAIVPIIDYCLGSAHCSIPVNVIRKNVEWFGIVAETEKGQVLLARREPGLQQSTGDMFIKEDEKQILVPDVVPSKNTNRDFVKAYLDELAGLTSLSFDPDSVSGFDGRPSFRDMAAFNFQPQNIIANPEVLFFKADTFEHREKLRTIFPYVLGVLTPDIMAKRYRLEELRREIRVLSRQLELLRQTTEKFLAELHIRLSRAREFGLVPEDTPSDVDQQTALRLLRRVITFTETEITASGVTSASSELADLRKREADLSMDLTQARQRWIEMNRLRDAAIEYSRALQTQEERLGISQWLSDESKRGTKCPVCGSGMDDAHNHLKELLTALSEVENGRTLFRTLPPTFDREYQRVRAKIELLTGRLEAVQRRIRALQEASDNERRRRYTELSISRFIGQVENELAMYDEFSTDEELRGRREQLAIEIAKLSQDVDEQAIKQRERRALERLSVISSSLLPDLGVEEPQNPVRLAPNDLALKIQRVEREDWLSEVGSGSNWLGYHLAISLGLQRYFLQLERSPVPSFLVFDQPSQVYFPKKLTDLDPRLDDDDAVRVHRIFKVINDVTVSEKKRLQTIILDHAASNVWGDIPEIHLVEEWRGADKLIPQDWLSQG